MHQNAKTIFEDRPQHALHQLAWVGEKINMLKQHFKIQFLTWSACCTDALAADHTKTEYESSPLCRQNKWQLEIEFMKFEVKINPQDFRK